MSNSCLKAFTLNVNSSANAAAWWPFEEAVGPYFDVVNGISLPLVSGDPPATQVPGKINFGINWTLAGTHQPLYETGDEPLLAYAGTGFDQFVWIKDASGTGSTFFNDYLLDNGAIEEFYLTSDPSSNRIVVSSIGFGIALNVAFSPVFGTWYLIRFYYNSTTGMLGLQINNGAKQEAPYGGSGSLTPSATGRVAIEPSTGLGDTLNISLDEYSIWIGPPNDSIAAQIWNGGAGHGYPL